LLLSESGCRIATIAEAILSNFFQVAILRSASVAQALNGAAGEGLTAR